MVPLDRHLHHVEALFGAVDDLHDGVLGVARRGQQPNRLGSEPFGLVTRRERLLGERVALGERPPAPEAGPRGDVTPRDVGREQRREIVGEHRRVDPDAPSSTRFAAGSRRLPVLREDERRVIDDGVLRVVVREARAGAADDADFHPGAGESVEPLCLAGGETADGGVVHEDANADPTPGGVDQRLCDSLGGERVPREEDPVVGGSERLAGHVGSVGQDERRHLRRAAFDDRARLVAEREPPPAVGVADEPLPVGRSFVDDGVDDRPVDGQHQPLAAVRQFEPVDADDAVVGERACRGRCRREGDGSAGDVRFDPRLAVRERDGGLVGCRDDDELARVAVGERVRVDDVEPGGVGGRRRDRDRADDDEDDECDGSDTADEPGSGTGHATRWPRPPV